MLTNPVEIFIAALRQELTAEDIDTHLEGCIGCGNCSHACAWLMVTNDERFHPKRRADMLRRIYYQTLAPKGNFLGSVGLQRPVTVEDLQEMVDSFYNCCTMCGRCALACPQGVSNRRLTQLGRNALAQAGLMPPIIAQIRTNAREKRHSFGLSFEESLGRAVSLAAGEGITVPVDQAGAEYLMGCSAIVNSRFPEVIVEGVKLLTQSGISYTMSSTIIDSGTEAMTTVTDLGLGREFITRLAQEAVRLGCKGVLIGECGCDLRTFMVESSEILGRYCLQPVYIDTLLLEAAKKGALPLVKLDLRVTYHDPCWSARLTGYYEEPRELLRLCVAELVEMTPNRQMNYCCNGGAGALRMFPTTDQGWNYRRAVSKVKAAQLEMTGAEMVVSPCTTCFLSLRDTISYYGLPMQATILAAIAYQSMAKALNNGEVVDGGKSTVRR